MPEKLKRNKKSKLSAKKKRKLTFKQLKWMKGFLKTGDKTKSAEGSYDLGSRGGSKTKKQRKKTASEIGQQLSKYLAKDIDAYYKKQNINVEWVLKRLVSKADLSKKEIIQLKALELIGKHKKMFTDKIKVDGEITNKVKIYIPDNRRDKKQKEKKND